MNKRVTADVPLETFQAVANRLTVTWAAGTAEAIKGARLARRLIWLCKQANWVPETTPASIQAVTSFFDANRPATFDLTAGTYAVYRSEVLSVLKPEPVRKGRYILQMHGIYREIHDLTVISELPAALRWRCSPFLWFLHEHEIMPPDITGDTLMEYYQFNLDVEQLSEDRARRRAKDAATYISHMLTRPEFATFGFVPVQISFRNRSIKYDVPEGVADAILKEFDERVVPWARGEASNAGESWSAYIERLDAIEPPHLVSAKKKAWRSSPEYLGRVAVEQQVARGPAHGFLPEGRRWAAATVKSRRDLCATCAKILFETENYKLETIEELTDPELLEAIAIRMRARNAEQNPEFGYINSIVTFVATMAKDFVQRPPDDLEKIKKIKGKYGRKRKGISLKNKRILRKFSDERIQALIDMPDAMIRDVNREVERRREAIRKAKGVLPRPVDVFDVSLIKNVMLVLSAHIMLARAPRKENLSGMKLEWIRWREGLATVEVPAEFVKSREEQDGPLHIPLNAQASRLLDQYLKALRPKVLHPDDRQNPFLFPSPPHAGKQRIGASYETMPDRLVDQVHERVGVRINPHLWRHLLGWIWLKEDPDKLPAVQKLLGHKSIQTTIDYYADIDESVVLTKWQEFLDGKRKKV